MLITPRNDPLPTAALTRLRCCQLQAAISGLGLLNITSAGEAKGVRLQLEGQWDVMGKERTAS